MWLVSAFTFTIVNNLSRNFSNRRENLHPSSITWRRSTKLMGLGRELHCRRRRRLELLRLSNPLQCFKLSLESHYQLYLKSQLFSPEIYNQSGHCFFICLLCRITFLYSAAEFKRNVFFLWGAFRKCAISHALIWLVA